MGKESGTVLGYSDIYSNESRLGFYAEIEMSYDDEFSEVFKCDRICVLSLGVYLRSVAMRV